jgi:hypothetical protein
MHLPQVPMLDAAIPLIEERAIFYREVFSGTLYGRIQLNFGFSCF